MTPLERIYKEVNARVNNAHELPDGTKDKDFQLGEDSAYAFVLGLIEELQEQEPQGLDDAAQAYEDSLGYYECMNQWPSVGFKAGAKWMAEQFELTRKEN